MNDISANTFQSCVNVIVTNLSTLKMSFFAINVFCFVLVKRKDAFLQYDIGKISIIRLEFAEEK